MGPLPLEEVESVSLRHVGGAVARSVRGAGDVGGQGFFKLGVGEMLSNLQCMLSNLRCMLSNLRCTLSNLKCMLSNLRCMLSNLQCMLSNLRCILNHLQCIYNACSVIYSNLQCVIYNACTVIYDACSVTHLFFHHLWLQVHGSYLAQHLSLQMFHSVRAVHHLQLLQLV